MNFDLKDFLNKLPANITRQELGVRIYEEIRAAENMKEGYLDQATENPAFYVDMSRTLDTFINKLKLLHNKVSPTPVAPDQEEFAAEQDDLEQIEALLKRVEQSEQNRHNRYKL